MKTHLNLIVFVSFFTIICRVKNEAINDSLPNFKFDLKKLDANQCNQFFVYCDSNNDSVLSQDEFRLVLNSLFASSKGNSYKIEQQVVENLFNWMDLNHDKVIDKNEFIKIWDEWISVILKPKSALVVVDMQNDFILDSASLRVANSEKLIPVINNLIKGVSFDLIVYTHDWHPSNHCSFYDNRNLREILTLNGKKILSKSELNSIKVYDVVTFSVYPTVNQTLWPIHGLQNSEGAKLHKDLFIAENRLDIFKGQDPDIDSYSAFYDNGLFHKTELEDKLKARRITDVYVTGVAEDYCAGSTTSDAVSLGFRTALVEDATLGIDPKSISENRRKLTERNTIFVKSLEVKDMVEGKDRRLEMGLILAKKIYSQSKRL